MSAGEKETRLLVFVPTYNERENAPAMYRQLKGLGLEADLLFLDDNSPDGTGQLLDDLAKADPSLRVIHRSGKLGIGSAHLEAIAWAQQHGYDILVTLDCDFTHLPSDIPGLLERAQQADVVVGSRYLAKNSLPNWNLFRRSLTALGHQLTVRLLGIPFDATGAFRLYNLRRLPAGIFQLVRSRGYAFFYESLFVLVRNGVSVSELAIVLPARTYGHSKMTMGEIRRSALNLFKLWAGWRLNPARFRMSSHCVEIDPGLVDPQGWDSYWGNKQQASTLVYEGIAALYRIQVIKRRLNAAMRGGFARGSRLLHAGCGSGQVDEDLQHEMNLTALDISPGALDLYSRNVPKAETVVHGNLFALPFPAGSFDGVYNLGVMEHFSHGDIVRILAEFRRVLKPGGKVLMFWPHRRASSVAVLRAVHWFFNRVLRKKTQFHPAEISLIASRAEATRLAEAAGLRLQKYAFNGKDGWVQAIIIFNIPDGNRA